MTDIELSQDELTKEEKEIVSKMEAIINNSFKGNEGRTIGELKKLTMDDLKNIEEKFCDSYKVNRKHFDVTSFQKDASVEIKITPRI